MPIRWRIVLLNGMVALFIVFMIAVVLFGLRLTDDFVRRIDAVHLRFEAIAELDGHANNYAEQIAEVLLLGEEQMEDFEAARQAIEEGFVKLAEVTRNEVLSMGDLASVGKELSDIEFVGRLRELYRAISRAVDEVFELKASGRQDLAVATFRDDVEYQLANDFEELITAALQDERSEVANELAEVRASQRNLLIFASVLSMVVLAACAVIAVTLYRAIVHPVRRLTEGANAIAEGRLDHRVKVQGADDFASLSNSFNKMAIALKEQRERLDSARETLEEQVEQRTSELTEVNDRLRRVDTQRSQFLADVSHELRTPLTILRGEADVALRGHDPRVQRESLDRIRTQAAEMTRLLEGLLSFARSEGEDAPFVPRPVDLRAVVAEAAEDGEVLARSAGASLIAEAAPEALPVLADEARLRQVLMIGLDNAIKYSGAGARIVIATGTIDGNACIEITDSGTGLLDGEQDKVFDRFYRGTHRAERAPNGLGIGLSIAKMIVERHGGSIALENVPERGARLRISLPLLVFA